ncbi:MAG TPA: ABC transporter permease [Bacteroidales bacterium]
MKNLTIIIRNLFRYKLFTVLNLTGLSIGLTCVLIIALWVYNETGYDKFNKNFDRIYQINFKDKEGQMAMAGSPAPLAPAIENNVAAVEHAARLRNAPGLAFKYKNNMYFEENGITADPQLFDIFSFKVIEGDPKKALDQVPSIVITESFAKRYFGSEDPLNKEIQVEGNDFVTVNAVIKDIPSQSHIQFDYILPQKLAEAFNFCGMQWGDPNFRTYVLLKKENNAAYAEQAITKVAKDEGMPHVKWNGNVAYLRPLKTIYLDYSINNRLGETGDYRYLYIFSSIAVLILILASINFINLTISLYAQKLKNTAVKKVCGAKRKGIFWSNFIENGSIVFIAFIVALAAMWYLRSAFQSLLNKQFGVHAFNVEFAAIVGITFIVTVLLCAVYPSFVFSGTRAIELMNRYNRRKSFILTGMVVFQNIIAVFLIIAVIGVNKQMQYISHKKLGFNTNRVAYTYLRGNICKKMAVVRQSLLQNPSITDISLKDCVPYNQRNGTVAIAWKKNGEWKNQGEANPIGMETTRIDDHYFDMMGVSFVAGRNFSKDLASDKQNYIVNEEAVRLMGLSNPVGTEFMLYGRKGIIVGVIKNTYFKSLHEKVNPQVFHLYNDESSEAYFSALFFRINGDIQKTMAYVEDVWVKNNPGIPYEYHFLDQDYEKIYKKDKRIAIMLNLFCVLAVFIACLGLFGQAVITSENKIKEIGIRKVNGAKITEILMLLNKNYMLWIGLAFIIACPIAWYAIHKWLENFAFKTNLSWWVFVLAGTVAVVVALLTISWQSWRAATRNPVESLRYE